MKAYELACVVLGTPGVGAFMSPSIHVAASTCRHPTRMAALDFSASPVNTAESLKRTSELSLEGMGNKKKIALLGSTVRPAKREYLYDVRIECFSNTCLRRQRSTRGYRFSPYCSSYGTIILYCGSGSKVVGRPWTTPEIVEVC